MGQVHHLSGFLRHLQLNFLNKPLFLRLADRLFSVLLRVGGQSAFILWLFQIAVINGTYLAVEHMRKDEGGKGGVIINIASTAGEPHLLSFYPSLIRHIVGYTETKCVLCQPISNY